MRREIGGAHPFVWAAVCGVVAVLAIAIALGVVGDPHRAARRAFLRQCHEQAFDQQIPDDCGSRAIRRFGRFNSTRQDLFYVLAALAVFAGTIFVVLYVVQRVGDAVEQPS